MNKIQLPFHHNNYRSSNNPTEHIYCASLDYVPYDQSLPNKLTSEGTHNY